MELSQCLDEHWETEFGVRDFWHVAKAKFHGQPSLPVILEADMFRSLRIKWMLYYGQNRLRVRLKEVPISDETSETASSNTDDVKDGGRDNYCV